MVSKADDWGTESYKKRVVRQNSDLGHTRQTLGATDPYDCLIECGVKKYNLSQIHCRWAL